MVKQSSRFSWNLQNARTLTTICRSVILSVSITPTSFAAMARGSPILSSSRDLSGPQPGRRMTDGEHAAHRTCQSRQGHAARCSLQGLHDRFSLSAVMPLPHASDCISVASQPACHGSSHAAHDLTPLWSSGMLTDAEPSLSRSYWTPGLLSTSDTLHPVLQSWPADDLTLICSEHATRWPTRT